MDRGADPEADGDPQQFCARVGVPHDTPVRLSIIIVNWNTLELLRACLRSIREASSGPSCEVIVVDNCSSDGSPQMVMNEFSTVVLIQMQRNVGFSAGNNAGINAAKGEYILLLNSDTEVQDNALQIMCDRMDSDPLIGGLGAQLLNPDGTIQASCRTFPSYRTALFHRKSLLTRLFPRNRFSAQYLMTSSDRDHSMEVDWVIGACLMTRRRVIQEVGLLDEGYFMYAEDVDWCYRMRQAGWKVVYEPRARIMHHYEKSARKAPYRMTLERHKSMWRFYRKHYSRGIVLMDVATLAGISARCALTVVRNVLAISGRKEDPK